MTDPVVTTPPAAPAVDIQAQAQPVLHTNVTPPAATPAPQEPAAPTNPPSTEPVDPAKADSPTDGKDGKTDEAKVGAPEKYEDFKLPEGFEVDPAAIEAFQPIAKELNLSQDQAQKLVDLQANLAKQGVERQQAEWNKITEEWRTSVKTDKEVGGQAYEQSLGHANTVLKQFGTPELMQALVDTGVGDHPEFVRVFSRIGKAMAEDKFHVGAATSGGPKDPAKTLFPNQN